MTDHRNRPTLITFLGRASANPRTGYRTATCRFPDGRVRETPFFGLALAEHLEPGRRSLWTSAASCFPMQSRS